MVTAKLAGCASFVIGIDFSSRLLEVARAKYQESNIEYIKMDLSAPEFACCDRFPTVTKVCFHSAIQYFTINELRGLISFFIRISQGGPLKVNALRES